MKKDILQKGIILPLIIGVVVAIAVFFAFYGVGNFYPVKANTVIGYFDSDKDSQKMDKNSEFTRFSNNQVIGTMEIGKQKLDVRYCSDYSNMANSVSMTNGSVFGKAGLCYLEVLNVNAADAKNQTIKVSGEFGNYSYKYAQTYWANNKNDVMLYNSKVKSGIALYYQKAEKYGFSSRYEVLVFEEVQE